MSEGHFRIDVADFLTAYFRLLDRVLGPLLASLGLPIPDLRLRPSGSIDERLQKIEAAKENLLESLAALDELKIEADENKLALQSALQSIASLEKKKIETQKEVEALRQVADLDASALKKLFDVPTPARIWRERLYGLVTGVFASLIATFVWAQVT